MPRPRNPIRSWIRLCLLIVGLYVLYEQGELLLPDWGGDSAVPSGECAVTDAFRNQRSNLQLKGEGQVIKVLPDDTQGSRHQKFLLRSPGGTTILVAHNIDLAPRLNGLRAGDLVAFYGEYEWSEKGGVLHWTHHDPRGRHPRGWLQYRGQRFE